MTKTAIIFLSIVLVGLVGILFVMTNLGSTTTTIQQSSYNHTSSTLIATGIQPKAIETVDFRQYFIQRDAGGECEPESVSIIRVSYGDVTGDGVEEAIVDWSDCRNGTGGATSEVYMIDRLGNVKNITPDSTALSTAEQAHFLKGFGGHGYYRIDGSNLTFEFPVYKKGDGECCPSGGFTTDTFRWDGSRFLFDKVSTDLKTDSMIM